MKKATFIVCLLTCFFMISCSNKKQEKASENIEEFASLISAYTGGVIPSNSPIVIELAEVQQSYQKGDVVESGIISFSPELKGTLYCTAENKFEFQPNQSELKRGGTYKVKFQLGKIIKVAPKYQELKFSFKVQEQDFTINVSSVVVETNNKKVAKVSGDINFRDVETEENAKKSFVASRGKESFTPRIEKETETRYKFIIENIPIKENETTLVLEGNSKLFKIDREIKKEVLIPGTAFKFLEYQISQHDERCIQLSFSEPISSSQDLRGIISVKGVKSYKIELDNNLLKIHYEEDLNSKEIKVSIDQSLKSSDGKTLKVSHSFSESTKQIPPQVRLLSGKTILPSANNLLIPFKTVNLYAVDLKIIKIYEKNVMMFLQDNELSDSYSLRRSGRLIHNERIILNTDPTKDIKLWNHYSIDISKYIKQEPGAIYRISLSAGIDYSAYSCDHEEDRRRQEALKRTSTEKMDLESEIWDKPRTYYSDDDYWGDYIWSDRENPCKPTYYNTNQCKASTNILASDIGIIVKANSDNNCWIAVNNLISTAPIADAEIKVYNFQLQNIATTKSDKNGFAYIELKNKPFLIVAESNGQKTYLKLNDGGENNLSRLDIGGKQNKKGLNGFIYGERGIWRPGDSLHIAFMLDDKSKKIPQHHPVSFELYNARGQFHSQQTTTLGLNGVYTFSVATQESDPTGIWNAYVKVGGASFHKTLQIETIRPNRLKIGLELMKGQTLEASQKTNAIKLTSAWLTGATSGNLKTDAKMYLRRTHSPFKNYKEYIFNNPASDFSSSPIELFEGTVDATGEGVFNFDIPEASDAPGMLQANVVCNVYEPGGEPNIATKSFPFSPFSSYVGIQLNNDDKSRDFETDSDITFDLVALNQRGDLLDNSSLEYKIYKMNWTWWWENDSESFSSYIHNSSIEPVKNGNITTKNGKAKINFRIDYPEWGRYFVFVKDKNSGHASGGAIFIDWPMWRGRSNKQDASSLKILPFSLSKESYECNEEVTAIIPQASKGRALVTIENGQRILSREWIDLSDKEDTKYSFKATKEMTPNVYIHLSVLQPHEQTVNDLPIRMYGIMPVFVNDKASVLQPEIKMDDVLQPEKEFTIKIKEKNNSAMTYTLAIVDEGLLDIVNFKTPNPWGYFYAREALGIKTWDMYDDVIGSFAGKYGSLLSIGGDEDILDSSKRKANRFKPVVKFMGPFELKSKGENKHKVTLPPYVGSVKVMLVAKQEQAYGKADKAVPVRAPLMLLSTLPRVVSVAEKITLPINVFAMEKEVKNVTVTVETTGRFKFLDKKSQTIHFNEPGDQLIFFDLATDARTGIEKVTITAKSKGHSTKEQIEIDVRNPNPPVINTSSGIIKSKQTQSFTYDLGDQRSDDEWIRLEVSRIPSIDINSRFDYLYDYDHCCTEQLTSKAFPLLYIGQFKELSEKEAEQSNKNIREAIVKLYGRQLSNGSFCYWPGSSYSNDWISSYAGNFLVMAKEKGYQVNEDALRRWKNYQTQTAQQWTKSKRNSNNRFSYDQSDLNQSYRLYTLALEGTPAMGAMNRMKGLENLSTQAKWRLAAAYALAGQKKAAEELVFKLTDDFEKYSSSNTSYGSVSRDRAMLLETLILMNKTEDAFKVAQKLASNLKVSDYNTQTTAYSLIAMGRLSEAMAGNLNFDWKINAKKQTAINSSKAAVVKELPLRPSKGEVQIENKSDGILYVNLVTKSKPLLDTLQAVNNNIGLEVKYKNKSGEEINVSKLKQGSDFVAEITVINRSLSENYTDLLLNYIVPTGWEIFNERLIDEQESKADDSFTYQDIRDDRIITYFDLDFGKRKSFKFRLNASYSGSFTLPAVYCEAMYDANVQARTRANRTIVIE